MKNAISLEVENPDVPFLFYLPKHLDDKLTDYAYKESKAKGKRVSKATVCRIALQKFLQENGTED